MRTVARRPVLVVKVENSLAARPQTGLNTAGIVFEELVEGGITRFAALFHSSVPPTVGPVRSLRDVDRAIAGPTHGLLVASGAAGVVRRRVARGAAQVVLPTSAGRYFRRTGSRPVPHNLYLAPRGVFNVARGRHRTPPDRTYLPFATSVATSTAVRYGHSAHRISLGFSPGANPRWSYDAKTRTWLRSEGSTSSRLTSGSRISARTVLVLQVHTRDAGYRDPAGNYVPQTVFVGSGKASVYCQGRRISALWSKTSSGTALHLVTRYGHKPLLIAPGRTWIEMLPIGGTLRSS